MFCIVCVRRNEAQVRRQDLNFSPLDLASYHVNYTDSSVTVSLFGLAKRKAIYREGLGATLIVERTEEEVRSQPFQLAEKPLVKTDSSRGPWAINWKIPYLQMWIRYVAKGHG
jgi:hypothetical protein